MKYKGIFFDWFNTLAGYEIPREVLYQKAFQRYGIELNARTIYKGIQRGDRYYFSKGAPLITPSSTIEEKARYYYLYPQFICDEAKLEIPAEIQLAVVQQALSEFTGKMVLYSDVLSSLETIKTMDRLVGVITNADIKAIDLIKGCAAGPLIDVIVTSEEARSEKPDTGIFKLALARAKLDASESVFVGDQYQNDVVGAKGAGLTPILLDRLDALSDGDGYQRINTLSEVIKYI